MHVVIPEEAVILVGGLGTRLGNLTQDKPKPMVPIGSRPFLEYVIVQLKNQGIKRFILATAYKPGVVEEYFGDGKKWGVEILFSNPGGRQLGTAGSIKFAQDQIRGDHFFVLNGDVYFDIDCGKLWDAHQKNNAVATLALAEVSDVGRYGCVSLGEAGLIRGFLEKRNAPGTEGGLVNGGIYIFKREILDLVPGNEDFSLERDIFPKLAGSSLYGVPFPKAYFIDIGILEDYERAFKELPKMPLFLDILK